MKILMITGSYPPMKCGVGDYTRLVVEALAKDGRATIGVLTNTDAAADKKPNIAIFPVADGWKLSDALPLLDAVRKFKPDIVHMQIPTQGYNERKLPWLILPLIALMGYPLVQTWHEYYPMGGLVILPNALLGGGLVAVRPNYLERMSPWFRWLNRRKQFRFIPNASSLPIVRLSEPERAAIHNRHADPSKGMLVYFGFVYPAKCVETLFEIADPESHHLVLVCDLDPSDPYQKKILELVDSSRWKGRATVTGFLPGNEAAGVLASAEAVVLPFRDGSGPWNTSVHASVQQGTFTLATSMDASGYDASRNLYLASPGDIPTMREALSRYAGTRIQPQGDDQAADWDAIAEAHMALYRSVLGRKARG